MANYTPTRMSSEIVARLRGLIARYDVNQETLATLCAVSQSQFSKIIRGVRPMSVDQFAVLCDVLEINAGELVAEVEEFLSPREASSASPIRLVSEGERTTGTVFISTDYLDGWASDARRRFLEMQASNVGGRSEDEIPHYGAIDVDALRQSGVALAADDRDGVQEEQEQSQELP